MAEKKKKNQGIWDSSSTRGKNKEIYRMVGSLSSPEGRQQFEDNRSRRTDCGALGHHHSNQPNNSARCKLRVLGFPVCPFCPSLSSMATLSVPGGRQLSVFPPTSKLPSSGGVHLLERERDGVFQRTLGRPQPHLLLPPSELEPCSFPCIGTTAIYSNALLWHNGSERGHSSSL